MHTHQKQNKDKNQIKKKTTTPKNVITCNTVVTITLQTSKQRGTKHHPNTGQ